MAYLEPVLYKHFYAITKEQLANSSLSKWEDYGLIIDKEIFEKIKQFEPINSNVSKNNKGFRITKNGRNTGIFKKIQENDEGNNIGNNINDNMQNNSEQQNNIRIKFNNAGNEINKIQTNIINEEDN